MVPVDRRLHGVHQPAPSLAPAPWAFWVYRRVIPAFAANHSTASAKFRCSISWTNVITSPFAWHPKQ